MHVFNYNVTLEDLIELNLQYVNADPRLRLQSSIFHFVVPMIIFLGSLGTIYMLDADKQLVLTDWLVPCVLAVFMLFLFPHTFKSNLRKRVAAQLKGVPEKNMAGKYSAKITPDLVVQTFKSRELRAPWTSMVYTHVTKEHIFLLIDETQGIVIPCKGLPSPEHFEQARALVAQYGTQGRATPQASN